MKHQLQLTALGVALLVCGQALAEPLRHKEGQQIYATYCASCHSTGVDGAPSIDNPEEWSERSSLWEAILFEHADKGYLDMPSRGGQAQLSEYEVKAAAEYMLDRVYPELPED